MLLDRARFANSLAEFKYLYAEYGGYPFVGLREGMAASWEGCKPALDLLLRRLWAAHFIVRRS